jgi:hypothetical protein
LTESVRSPKSVAFVVTFFRNRFCKRAKTKSVAELKKCRACGVEVQANAPFGHCPTCILALGFGSPLSDAPEEPLDGTSFRSFGDYEILKQIGRGWRDFSVTFSPPSFWKHVTV